MDITWKHPQFQIRRNFPPEEEFEGITQVTSLEQSLYERAEYTAKQSSAWEISSGQRAEQTVREGPAFKQVSEYSSLIGLCTWSQQGILIQKQSCVFNSLKDPLNVGMC